MSASTVVSTPTIGNGIAVSPAAPDHAPVPEPLTILWRGPSLVAVDKPAGLAVHRGWAEDDGDVINELAAAQLGQPVFPVHRLDRATSGVLLLALSSATAAAMQQAFQAGAVEKTYLAIVRGTPPASGTIDHPVPRSKELVGPEHRVPAVTDFETLATGRVVALDRSFSLVRCWPRTGRQHQIRRHFKHLSHPIVGDVNYGKGDITRHFRAHMGLARLALHATRLRLAPLGEAAPVPIDAPLPPDFSEALRRLGIAPTPPFSPI